MFNIIFNFREKKNKNTIKELKRCFYMRLSNPQTNISRKKRRNFNLTNFIILKLKNFH